MRYDDSKKLLQNILLSMVVLIIAIGCLEAGARVAAALLHKTPLMIYSPTIGWKLRPNTSKIFEKSEFKVWININSKGLRDKEYTYEKSPDVFRIVALGDSNLFGWGVEEHECFASLLEKWMKDVEVINMGIPGYGTDQELIYFKEEGKLYRPDMVILQLCTNDLKEIKRLFIYQKAKPRFIIKNNQLVLTNVPVTTEDNKLRIVSFLRWHSYAYSFLEQRVRILKKKFGSIGRRECSNKAPVKHNQNDWNTEENKRLFIELVKELNRSAAECDAKLLIVNMEATCSELVEMLKVVKDENMMICDISPKIQKIIQHKKLTFEHDGHWNTEGHRVIAEEIKKFLIHHNVLSRLNS
jgi:lysophospholipase L1-like esterase